MAKAYTFLADRPEEVECLAVVGVPRCFGMEVMLVFIIGDRKVTSSHGIELGAGTLFEDVNPDVTDVLFLPGGMLGTNNLKAYAGLRTTVECANKQNRRITAICAASSILGSMGLLKGRTATYYPGFEDQLTSVSYTSQGIVTDGNITAGRGLELVLDMELELVCLSQGPQQAQKITAAIQYNWKQYPDEKNSCSVLYHMDVGWGGSLFYKKRWCLQNEHVIVVH